MSSVHLSDMGESHRLTLAFLFWPLKQSSGQHPAEHLVLEMSVLVVRWCEDCVPFFGCFHSLLCFEAEGSLQFLQKWHLQSTQLIHCGTKTVALKCLTSEPRLPPLVNSTFHDSSEAVRGFLVFSIVFHCGSLGSKETLGKSSIPKKK